MSGPSPCGGRIAIQGVRPQVDCARYDAKAVVGERVTVAADLVREGHQRLAAAVRYRPRGEQGWREAPLELAGNDRYAGSFPAERIGRWEYRVVAWTDHWTTWRRALQAKVDAGVDDAEIAVELADGTRVAADNVLIVRVPATADLAHPVDPIGSGELVLLRDGREFTGTWEKPSARANFRWLGPQGQPLRLARGTTWIELVPEDGSVTVRDATSDAGASGSGEGS
ncbi:MAG: hypothetical protein BRC31_07025 [Actinobacteria bacterium QS_5_72_10]|nr:MAG: hypothetical protein BRC31_07025 [Actinobacteria bacterium QS_5_72_10]